LGMRSTLRSSHGQLVLEGHKWNITNAPVADHLIVFCYDETGSQRLLRAVIVPRGAPGVETRPQRLIGCEGSPTGEVLLRDVEVDPTWVLLADGRELLEIAFLRERLLAPWPLIGKMGRVLQEAIDHVETRRQFSAPLKEFQYVQEKIVSSWERLETSRLLARQAVEAVALGRPSLARASLAKHHATDAAAWVFRTLMEVYGSHGLQREARLGAYMTDAVCATVAGGTREMHKRVIFDQLLLDRARSKRQRRSRCFHVTDPED